MNGVLIILDIVGTAQGHLMRANYWKSSLCRIKAAHRTNMEQDAIVKKQTIYKIKRIIES